MRNFKTSAQAAVTPLSDFTQPDCLPLTISKLLLGITPMPIPLTQLTFILHSPEPPSAKDPVEIIWGR